MAKVRKITAIHDKENVCEVTNEDCLTEMLGVIKLMYSDTQRILRAINAEVEVYNGMIERAATQDIRDELLLDQARAAQKPAVNARSMTAIIDAVNRMYKISQKDEEVDDGKLVFINDMEDTPDIDHALPDHGHIIAGESDNEIEE